jgi:hypothetical protein
MQCLARIRFYALLDHCPPVFPLETLKEDERCAGFYIEAGLSPLRLRSLKMTRLIPAKCNNVRSAPRVQCSRPTNRSPKPSQSAGLRWLRGLTVYARRFKCKKGCAPSCVSRKETLNNNCDRSRGIEYYSFDSFPKLKLRFCLVLPSNLKTAARQNYRKCMQLLLLNRI